MRRPSSLVPSALVAVLLTVGLVVPVEAAAETASVIPASYQQVSASFTDRAGTTSSGEVACPVGTRVLGGGAVIGSSDTRENLTASVPAGDGSRWRVSVSNTGGTDGTFVVRATCARRVAGYVVVTGDPTTGGVRARTSATVSCPDGTVPLGGGGTGTSASGDAFLLAGSLPEGNGWRVDLTRFTRDVLTTATVVCGVAPTGYLVTVSPSRVMPPGEQTSWRAFCPNRLSVVGGGAEVVGAPRSVWAIAGTAPNGGSTWRVDANSLLGPRTTLTVHAVCARVEPAA